MAQGDYRLEHIVAKILPFRTDPAGGKKDQQKRVRDGRWQSCVFFLVPRAKGIPAETIRCRRGSCLGIWSMRKRSRQYESSEQGPASHHIHMGVKRDV